MPRIRVSTAVGRTALAVALVLVAAEVLFRAWGPVLPIPHRTGPVIEADATLGWRNIPGETTWIRSSHHTARIDVNAAGGVGPLPAEPVGRPGVLVIGDGLVAVPPERYEQTLAAKVAADLGASIVTFAVSGYGTDQETLSLEELLPRWRPEIVVLVLNVTNDVRENDVELDRSHGSKAKPYFTLDPSGGIRPTSPGAVTLAERARGLVARSALLSAVKSSVDSVIAAPAAATLRRDLDVLREPEGEWARAWTITDRLVERAAATARGHDAMFLVVIAPHPCQVEQDECLGTGLGSSGAPQQRILALAQRIGAHSVDLLPALTEAARAGPAYYPGEGIWTERGNTAAAPVVARAVRQALRVRN